jgi:hypothetical protein
MEQEWREAPVGGIDGRDGRGLLFAQRRTAQPHETRAATRGGRLLRDFCRADQAAGHQRAHWCAPVIEAFPESVGGGTACEQQFQQLPLPGSARQGFIRDRGHAFGCGEPALGGGARRGTSARQLGQRGGEHLAQRMVVVLRGPFDQLQNLTVDDGLVVQHVEHGLELVARQLGRSRDCADDADQPLPPEGHADPRTDLRGRQILRWQVVEQPAQRRIQRDAQYHRCRQDTTLGVFHNVCG